MQRLYINPVKWDKSRKEQLRQGLGKKIIAEFVIWRRGALPGLVILILVIVARLSGWLQFLEWMTLDALLRWRPQESIDERIVIIGINDGDIRQVGTYPIPDQEIAKLLRTLQTYNPRAIGIDIIRDIPVEPGHDELVTAFRDIKTIIAIDKVLFPPMAAPPTLPSEQVGFADVIHDTDGQVRRSLLGTPTSLGYKFSFPLRLAQMYLAAEGISLENGTRDPHAMRFGETEIPRFLPNSGGYVDADAGGVQVLLNFRNSREGFRTLSLDDINRGNFPAHWIRDRVVLIGITSPGVNDIVNTTALTDLQPSGQIYGVEFQAHGVSQIISAVLDRRPLLNVWSDRWEYLWIISWGVLALSVGRLTQSSLQNLGYVSLASLLLLAMSYGFIRLGWWIPVAPVLLVLVFNGMGISAFAFYKYDRALKSQLEVRQRTIEQTFNRIHNQPMQTLAYVIKQVQDQDLSSEMMVVKLQQVKAEIWDVCEYLKWEALSQYKLSKNKTLQLSNDLIFDLEFPIHELFYTVSRHTLERDLPEFKTLKIKVLEFAAIAEEDFNFEQKRGLCEFIEEGLCNVGKHAVGVTRLKVIGKIQDGWYSLSIQDNGVGIRSLAEGHGTKQCKRLAKQLAGEFKRESISGQGTLCELTWRLARRRLDRKRLDLRYWRKRF
ncbi:CHASE2 domain-containing protein [Coleofasciculus sp.]|uniref:CHASE2 domain-containing protein n=1 Tax=Coleofasciculus sp. TaxID=3100458 RepID=UPI0039F887A3